MSGSAGDNFISALLPRGEGCQFVMYGDSCSGLPGGQHEKTFASVNAVVRRLQPQPEFILFLGDEIVGLTPDAEALRAQWRHWLDAEMAWLDRGTTPVWHTTSNHATYDAMSEEVFRTVLKLPCNGPAGQDGLSYFVRRNELLMVFVHTSWSGLGGEGHVETAWLEATLKEHKDARHKVVLGHHPVFPINGFAGAYQRELGPEYSRPFWDILVDGGVLAYLCSHILAFDAQVHRGVLQICTAGAGTAHRMPEGIEYLHCVQAALDQNGLRYQVLDTDGVVRERLEWPLPIAGRLRWHELQRGETDALCSRHLAGGRLTELRLRGKTGNVAAAQTMFSAFSPGEAGPLWLGLRGTKQTLTALVQREPGRSPNYWLGPDLAANDNFDIHVAFYSDMGPGGLLYRHHDDPKWSSLIGATATGVERLDWPSRWSLGHGPGGISDRPYLGSSLTVSIATS
jgi:hypothetical protein